MLMQHELCRQIFDIYSDFIKICPAGAELFLADGRMQTRTDRQTDILTKRHDEIKAAFRNFEKLL